MTSTSPLSTAPARRRLVVDAPTRMFHALLALSFAGAYLTAGHEAWRPLHATLGYGMAGLLGWRVLYGLVGPRAARLSALGRKLQALPAWWRGRPLSAAGWRQGATLAMAASVAGLLLLVGPTVLSGHATWNDWGGEWLEDVHETLGNGLLAVVMAHVGLVLAQSLARRRNLALAMVTGRAEGLGPDLVSRNRAWLATALLVAFLGFGAWVWQSPALLAGEPAAHSRHHHGHDHDD